MLNVIAGLNKAYRGKVLINGKLIRDYKGNSLYRKNLGVPAAKSADRIYQRYGAG